MQIRLQNRIFYNSHSPDLWLCSLGLPWEIFCFISRKLSLRTLLRSRSVPWYQQGYQRHLLRAHGSTSNSGMKCLGPCPQKYGGVPNSPSWEKRWTQGTKTILGAFWEAARGFDCACRRHRLIQMPLAHALRCDIR